MTGPAAPVKPTRVSGAPAPVADLWSDLKPGTARDLLLAAVDAFSENGYAATTTRDIARRVGMSPAAVYVHYRSKTDLLYEISRRGHADVLAKLEEATAAAKPEPKARLSAMVEAFTEWHAENHTLARVIQFELRALEPHAFDQIRATRRRFEEIVEVELSIGIADGIFAVEDVTTTTIAILSLGIDLARWYNPRRNVPPAELGALYARMVINMVSAGGSTPTPGPQGGR